jgi:hypothetical protein
MYDLLISYDLVLAIMYATHAHAINEQMAGLRPVPWLQDPLQNGRFKGPEPLTHPT